MAREMIIVFAQIAWDTQNKCSGKKKLWKWWLHLRRHDMGQGEVCVCSMSLSLNLRSGFLFLFLSFNSSWGITSTPDQRTRSTSRFMGHTQLKERWLYSFQLLHACGDPDPSFPHLPHTHIIIISAPLFMAPLISNGFYICIHLLSIIQLYISMVISFRPWYPSEVFFFKLYSCHVYLYKMNSFYVSPYYQWPIPEGFFRLENNGFVTIYLIQRILYTQ